MSMDMDCFWPIKDVYLEVEWVSTSIA
jgi:hypothetical protein